MSRNPPAQIDPSERRIHGLTYRQVTILATAGLLALGCLVGLKTWPLWIRICLALACAAIALFWAFWQDKGQTLEGRLQAILSFHRRIRYRLHRGLPLSGQGKVVMQDSEPPTQVPAKSASRTATLDWRPGVLWITANTIGVSILAGLTFWLLQGGAHQLELIWSKI